MSRLTPATAAMRLLLAGGTFLVPGCAAPAPAPTSSSGSSTPQLPPTTAAAPTPTPEAKEVTFTIECGDMTFHNWQDAWLHAGEADLSSCEAWADGGDAYTDIQQEATEVAGYDSVEDVDTLVGLCAELEGYYTRKNNDLSGGQADEAAGMLVLCPDFPKAKVVRANIALGARIEKERKAGTRFSDDSYRVGKDIKSGTYFIPKTVEKGCYWERLNKRGDIIDNNVVMARTRVQVTIRPTDYTFNSERCGEWRRK